MKLNYEQSSIQIEEQGRSEKRHNRKFSLSMGTGFLRTLVQWLRKFI